jgi:energy-coupling factor transport system substrate-specific component
LASALRGPRSDGVSRSAPGADHLSADRGQAWARWSILTLCIFGFIWGLLYGAIVNVYFWPFAGGPAEQTWTPGIGLGETLARYAAFYVVTSLAWDLTRAVGNVALILLLGAPMVKALERFRRRFNFEVKDVDQRVGSTQEEAGIRV